MGHLLSIALRGRCCALLGACRSSFPAADESDGRSPRRIRPATAGLVAAWRWAGSGGRPGNSAAPGAGLHTTGANQRTPSAPGPVVPRSSTGGQALDHLPSALDHLPSSPGPPALEHGTTGLLPRDHPHFWWDHHHSWSGPPVRPPRTTSAGPRVHGKRRHLPSPKLTYQTTSPPDGGPQPPQSFALSPVRGSAERGLRRPARHPARRGAGDEPGAGGARCSGGPCCR
jgi:hypothetical protein